MSRPDVDPELIRVIYDTSDLGIGKLSQWSDEKLLQFLTDKQHVARVVNLRLRGVTRQRSLFLSVFERLEQIASDRGLTIPQTQTRSDDL